MPRLKTKALLGAAALALPISTLASSAAPVSAASSTTTINVVGYSVVKAAYKSLEAAFQKTPAGKNVVFTNTFGASTTEAQAVANGLPADFVNFSTAPDVDLVAKAGIVDTKWINQSPTTKGNVTNSVVVIVVRPGNPKHIKSWADLTKSGVSVVTPDPRTSGSARWNLLAAYQQQFQATGSAKKAQAYVLALLKNTISQPASGSVALAAFLGGTGDALLAYEDDARFAAVQGKQLQVIVPASTFLIENPAAVTKTGQKNPAAKAFFSYLLSTSGQTIWAQNDFRPVLPSVAKTFAARFPTPQKLGTITQLGGWGKVTATYFNPTNGIITKLETQAGH